jgi:polyferredoxin
VKRILWVPWRWWRRIAQLALLLLFVWLFRRTEFTGTDTLPGGENLFFRLDPLVGAAAIIGGRGLVSAFWPALAVLVLTLVLGRFFCGWVCPLGTLLDLFQRLVRPVSKRTGGWAGGAGVLRRFRVARYVLLLACLFGAAFAFPLVGFADPFVLLFRGLTFWGDPRFFSSADAVLTWTGQGSASPVQQFVVRHLLPFRAAVFDLAAVSAVLLAVIFALELLTRRFWCRYLCPLGALLGLAGRFALVRRLPARVCKDCGQCAANCRMDALGAGVSPESCNLCMDCVDDCPRSLANFAVPRSRPAPAPLDISRRGFLAAAVAGAATPVVAGLTPLAAAELAGRDLLRPPGAGDERRFLNLCIRCGLCMKVCPTNVLQPALLQSGVEGMFSPRLAPRAVFEQSYCEYNCNLCGQVCPTGAIPPLALEQKHKTFVGKAYFDHEHCLPWAKRESCIRCEEVCPLPEKAIKIQNTFNVVNAAGQEIEIQQPRVERYLCIGCGMCEAVCPISPSEGAVGIFVLRVEAPDPQTEFLTGE